MRDRQNKSQVDTYSLDYYRGIYQWCFAIVLNKALGVQQDQAKQDAERAESFSKNLLRFNETRKLEWFDEYTQKLIRDNQSDAVVRLWELRNYFSHYRHSDKPLFFEKENPLRIILVKAYEKAIFECRRKRPDFSLDFPPLFEKSNRITAAGVALYASFFVERRFMGRLLGFAKGFKKDEGEYKCVRDIFRTYSLPDRYSVQAQDKKAFKFRNILGYLNRFPSIAYQHYYPNESDTHKEGDRYISERKTDKFISFAIRYLEDFSPGGYDLKFGRKKIERTVVNEENEHKPHRIKTKERVIFDDDTSNSYYIDHHNVILEITNRKGGEKRTYKLGEHELKYLVLLCFMGKGEEATRKLYNYKTAIENKLPHIEQLGAEELKYFPRFLLKKGANGNVDGKAIANRREYIREKWKTKLAESKGATLHEKARDILQSINETMKPAMNTPEYNRLFELLINKDVNGFQDELIELKRRGRISEDMLREFNGLKCLDDLHQKACQLVLQKLDRLKNEALCEYIGLKKEGNVLHEEKLKRFKNNTAVYKGFLRDAVVKDRNAQFWEQVQAEQKKRVPDDVLLERKYYHLATKKKYDSDNLKLWETLAKDRLCLMMAWDYLQQLNQRMARNGEGLEWNRKKKEICLKLNSGHQAYEIIFNVSDFAKQYVWDDPEFLRKLIDYFIGKGTRKIAYHTLCRDGIEKYSEFQKECMQAILAFEEEVVTQEKIPLQEKTHISIDDILGNTSLCEGEKFSIKKIRNAVFHYTLDFEPAHLKRFYEFMEEQGIKKQWSMRIS